MNYQQAIQKAQCEFIGETAEHLTTFLNILHTCASVRFGVDLPGCWTYGSIREVQGVLQAHVWQQTTCIAAGNLTLRIRFLAGQVAVTVVRGYQATNDWIEGTFSEAADARKIADWVCDEWDKVLCARFNAKPLPENQRYFG